MMDNYQCLDVTERAHGISPPLPPSKTVSFGPITPRYPKGASFSPNGKVRVRTKHVIDYGSIGELNLSGLEQIVTIGQTNSIIAILQKLPAFMEEKRQQKSSLRPMSLGEWLEELNSFVNQRGLNDAYAPGQFNGNLVRPRIYEIAGAINRLRSDGAIAQMKK